MLFFEKKTSFLIFTILLIINQLSAQEYTSKSRKAIAFYQAGLSDFQIGNYDAAIFSLKQAIEKDRRFIEPHLLLAETYALKKNYNLSVEYYDKALNIDENFFPFAVFLKAEVQLKQGEYEKAELDFSKYINHPQTPTTKKNEAQQKIKLCQFAEELKKQPIRFNPNELSGHINTKYDDMGPRITADGKHLFFTITIPHDPYKEMNRNNSHDDFFVAQLLDSINWSEPQNLGSPINTNRSEGAIAISANGQKIFFAACNRPDGIGRCDIYQSEWQNGQWSQPRNLQEPINTKHWESQPALSPDGKSLYFVSDRKGGKGRLDIWVSHLSEQGTWQKPINLGDSINTTADEFTPFLHFDNQTLYFSSNGKLGMGEQDIFMATRTQSDTVWLNVKNLGYPLNNHHDNYGLIVDAQGKNGYFSSYSEKTKSIDLFDFVLDEKIRPKPTFTLALAVTDQQNRRSIVGEITLQNIKKHHINQELTKSAEQKWVFTKITKQTQMAINCLSAGYNLYSAVLDTVATSDTLFFNIEMKKTQTGDRIVLQNIYFDLDASTLTPESIMELKKLQQFLTQNPNLIIEIGGHTDDQGVEAYNKKLSTNRAKAVFEYLKAQGVPSNQLTYKGYGYESPLIKATTDRARQKNRRTEFTIIKQ